VEFLGRRRTADHRAALEHHDAQPGAREVGSAGETVMPGADDDRL